MPDSVLPASVIVFDGVCVLCSRWVAFVLRRDRSQRFKFAAMQTATGRKLLVEHDIDPDDPLSFLLLEDGVGYTDTDAIVRILRRFGSGWRLVAALVSIVPRFVRDPLYRWIARHRYRLFGQRPSCLIPPADIADRFLH
jgi:predicted DCC family thiol-disulfide oxidoreductase YuxK